MAESAPAVSGTQGTAEQYNDLRNDAIDPTLGHVHDGTAGKTMLGTATPYVESGAGAVGTSALLARQDHVHPAQTIPAPGSATPVVESGSGSSGSATPYSRQDHVHPAAAAPGNHTYTDGFLGADAQCSSSSVWATGPSMTLGAGVWLVVANAMMGVNTSGTTFGVFTAIRSGGSVYATSLFYGSPEAPYGNVAMSCIISVGSSQTVSLDFINSGTGTSTMFYRMNAAQPYSSSIRAIRLGH